MRRPAGRGITRTAFAAVLALACGGAQVQSPAGTSRVSHAQAAVERCPVSDWSSRRSALESGVVLHLDATRVVACGGYPDATAQREAERHAVRRAAAVAKASKTCGYGRTPGPKLDELRVRLASWLVDRTIHRYRLAPVDHTPGSLAGLLAAEVRGGVSGVVVSHESSGVVTVSLR